MRETAAVEQLFGTLTDLTDLQRNVIKRRYTTLMNMYTRYCLLYSLMFYVFRLTVTLGSLAVPALLTLQNTSCDLTSSTPVFWFTWALSLAVTTSNGIMLLFKLDKRFFMMHAVTERLRAETWQYIELAGRYSGHHCHDEKPTHANQFVYYCTHLERINMKWVDEEFIKTGEEKVNSPPTQQQIATITGGSRDALVPSPPEQIELVLDEEERLSGRLLGDADENHAKSRKKLKKTAIREPVQSPQGSPAVSESSSEGDVVLYPTPTQQGEPDVRVRTDI